MHIHMCTSTSDSDPVECQKFKIIYLLCTYLIIILNFMTCVCEQVTSGRTALHLTASLGFKDVAKVLLQRKALVTVEDAKGCTPLFLAASNGNYEIAKLIIASPDCDVNAITKVL